MKKSKALLLGMAVLCGLEVSAQEPQKPSVEMKVYQSEDNTYVNKKLPLFLYFSTSKEAGAKKYLLESKATGEYANPMYLDTEGANFIRHRWAVEQGSGKTVYPKKEVIFEIYADGLAPVTSSTFTGAPRYYSGGTVYYGKGLTISLASRDAVSGVDALQYSINGGAYAKYNNPLNSFTEGNNAVYYYGYDNVGNVEATRTKEFVYDISAPTSSSQVVGIQHGSLILAPSSKVSLTSNDNLSGVNRIVYIIDDGTDRRYYGPISLAGLSDGDHTVYYYAYDNVKNEEVRKSLSFYLDRIAPETNHALATDVCNKNGVTWVSPRTKITLTSTDNKAGVFKTYYRLGRSMSTVHNEERIDYSAPFSIPNKYGFHVVKYDAMDNVQNLGNNRYLKVYMDNVAPETGIIYGYPQFFTRDTLFVNSKTKITLRATDRGSGVTETTYNIDGGSKQTYSGNFNLEKEGYRTINFKSVDCVNNEEQNKSSNCFVDNTPPKIFYNFSINPIGKKGANNVYPNYTRLYIGATDKHVGTKTIRYSMNGGPLTLYSSPQTLDISELNRFASKKKYEVRIVAEDMLGNTSEETVTFYVGLDTPEE